MSQPRNAMTQSGLPDLMFLPASPTKKAATAAAVGALLLDAASPKAATAAAADCAADTSRMDGSRFKEEGERLAAEEEKTSEQVPMVRELFAELDEDNSGTLDKGEVRKLLRRLGMRTDTASLNGVMLSMDPDGDGDVTLAEFLAWWRESGTEFKHKMAALAAATAAECDREDAASVLTQRHYRGYRTRHRVMLSELGVHHIYMPPNTRCIHVLQLATILRSPPSARGAAAIRLVESLVTRMEAGQEPKRQFFTTMEPSMRRMLLSHCRIVTFKAAHYVFEQGERSNDTFYFIVSGKTGVVIDGDTKREMHPGATFGEKALAQEADVGLRTAGIIAVTDCIMATLTRADYYRTNGTLEKQVVKVLRLHGDDRTETQVALSKSLFGETEFFQKLHHDAICTQLARACQHARVKKNELLFRQGEDAETFYIIVQGFVRVVIDGKVALNLGPGMTFGELGVTGVTPAERRRTATIIGGQVPGVVTKQQWGQPADSQSDHMKRSESKVDVCDLAVISREDYLFYTQGTEDAVREVLSLSPNHRTDDHLKLLMNLFAESRFFKQMSSALMQRQVCRSLQMTLCPPGYTLFNEGDPGDLFYLIIRGTIKGIVPGTQNPNVPDTASRTFELHAGDTFGDLAVTGRTEGERKRTATMRCKDECFLAVLSRPAYLKVSGALEENAYAVLRKDPTRRKESDLALLSSYFAELDFFKELHFPMLQVACSKTMTLKALDADEVLFAHKEWSDGVFYILLRGRLRVEIDGTEVGRYNPIQEFGTSQHALSIDPDKGDDNFRLRCDRKVTAMPLRDDERLQNRIRIDGFPRSWKSAHLFEVFQGFGTIDSIRVLSKNADSEANDTQFDVKRWAIIQFAHAEVAKRASREKMVVVLDDDTDLPMVREHVDQAARKPLAEAFPLDVDMMRDVAGESTGRGSQVGEITVESLLVEQADSDRDVVVAALTRDNYIDNCHDVLQEILAILAMKPRSRTVKQLHLLKDFFETTSVFTGISHSNMLQRNLSRFLGLLQVGPNEQIYYESDRAETMYIVIRGRVKLSSIDVPEPKPDDMSYVRTAGQTVGEEVILDKRTQYRHTAVADGPTILALVFRDDYMRICSTGDMQRTIDTFWSLGVQESAPPKPGEEPVLDFDGYKQIYLRIGKVIATKERFSVSELRSAMHADWENDLKEFGDPSMDVLTHWQYTESLYQLIDEWCGGVESTQLYSDLLRLMLDYSTNPTDTGVVLRPLNNVPCKFQQLSDLRHIASQGVIQEQRSSKVGTAQASGGSSEGFKKAFLAQGLGPTSSSKAPGAPKFGGATQTKEEKEEQYFREMFNSIDVDGGGTLDRSEVAQLSINMGRELRQIELDAAMAEMDPNGDGSVDFDEFKTWFKALMESDELVREVFEAADKDESGVIDRDELRSIMKELGNPLSPTQLDEAMSDMDSDGSGEIDFVEFSAWWSKLQSTQTLRAQGQDPQAAYYKEMFLKADTGGEGSLDRDELSVLMIELGREMADYELDTAMQLMDEDGGGTVDFEEFSKWFAWLLDGDMSIRKIFDSVDSDGSGNLDHDEVRVALQRLCAEGRDGQELTAAEVQEAIKLMDTDGSGEIDFDEFSTWWNVYEFQQRFKPDDPVVAHHRNTFDEIAKQSAERHGAAGNDEAMKEAVLQIMQGHGTVDIQGFLELCFALGRQIHRHEQQEAIRDVTEGSNAQQITFEAFMNFFDNLRDEDRVLQDMFEGADQQRYGVLLRDGITQLLRAFRQNQARRRLALTSPNPGNKRQSDIFVDDSQQAADGQSAIARIIAGADYSQTEGLSYAQQMQDALDVEVTSEEVEEALAQMHAYQKARYRMRRSMEHGPTASLLERPMKGQIDFDSFRYWATVQQSRDPALHETARISVAETRKQERKQEFFHAMVGSDPNTQAAITSGLSVDMPMSGWNDEATGGSPSEPTPTPLRQPASAPASFEGVGRLASSLRQPATSTGVPGRRSRRRSGAKRNDKRPLIELQLSHRRPLTPSGSSAAWPPMLPARASTLGASKMAARTSQQKRNDGYRPHTFDELLLINSTDDMEDATAYMNGRSATRADGSSSSSSSGRPQSVRGTFRPVQLRPTSAGALESYYNSDDARLTRGARATAVWGSGLAVASEKRAASKIPLTTKPHRREPEATEARQRVPGNWQRPGNARLGTPFARPQSPSGLAPSRSMVELGGREAGKQPWHERLSSTGSRLERLPSFLDPSTGGRQYPGLGTRLNALHATRNADATVVPHTGLATKQYEDDFASDRDAPLIARFEQQAAS